ncbi:hypothetical protein M0805_008552 [Coniferiporia weirii]|nr:hypothetical protein M0805_008552 [Coniferiporia weirii]
MVRSFFLLPFLAAVASAAQLAVQSGRVSIASSDGAQLHAETFDIGGVKSSTPLALGQTDLLKLTFTITEKEKGKGVQPHQTFLRFYDEETGEEGIQPVRVSPAGKAKFELNMARPPLSLPPTGKAPLQVTLILGSFVHDPLQVHLFDLVLPASAPPPQHTDEPSFHLLPEIEHTFRPDPKSPPQIISAVFAAIVLSPWLMLLPVLTKVPHKVPHLFSPKILSFVALLAAFEGLLLWYWVALRLGQVLAYGAVLGFFTVFAGKSALNTLAKLRIEGKGN